MFKEIPKKDWPPERVDGVRRKTVLLGKTYLVQVFEEHKGVIRLSINHTKRKGSKWSEGITWQELQDIKDAAGFKYKVAVEVFPERHKIINVANMRHLFVLPERPDFVW